MLYTNEVVARLGQDLFCTIYALEQEQGGDGQLELRIPGFRIMISLKVPAALNKNYAKGFLIFSAYSTTNDENHEDPDFQEVLYL